MVMLLEQKAEICAALYRHAGEVLAPHAISYAVSVTDMDTFIRIAATASFDQYSSWFAFDDVLTEQWESAPDPWVLAFYICDKLIESLLQRRTVID